MARPARRMMVIVLVVVFVVVFVALLVVPVATSVPIVAWPVAQEHVDQVMQRLPEASPELAATPPATFVAVAMPRAIGMGSVGVGVVVRVLPVRRDDLLGRGRRLVLLLLLLRERRQGEEGEEERQQESMHHVAS